MFIAAPVRPFFGEMPSGKSWASVHITPIGLYIDSSESTVLAALVCLHDERTDFLCTLVSCDCRRFNYREWDDYCHKYAEFQKQHWTDKGEFVHVHCDYSFQWLMGMPAAAASRPVLRTVIVGGAIEMVAIRKIDNRTAGRNKQSYGQYKNRANFIVIHLRWTR